MRVLIAIALLALLSALPMPSASAAADFSPSSTSWTSPTHGWVLGWVPCGDNLCAQVRSTDDGGRTWSSVHSPVVHPSEYGEQTRIFVAERGHRSIMLITDGRMLQASYDGARSWQRERLGIDQVGAIDATSKAVYVAGLTSAGQDVSTSVLRTPINKRKWTTVRAIAATAPGNAASTSTDVSAQQRAVQVSTSSFGAGGAVWTSRNENRFAKASPCDEFSATRVGVASRSRQFALCSFNPGRGEMDKQLMTTSGGASYTPVAMAPRVGITSDFAVAGAKTLAIGSTGGDEAFVLMSFDGGATWEATLAEPDTGPVLDLEFQDATHGTLVAGYPTLGTSRVYRTVDGGHSWLPVSVGR